MFRHCETHIDKKVPCDVCGKILKNLTSLKDHKRFKHSVEGQTICRNCKQSFPHEDYPKHKCDQVICNDCGIILNSKSILSSHIQNMHRINEKSHICTICGKGFIRNSIMRAHRRKHEKQPTPCPVCGIEINKRITLVSRDTLITHYNLWYCNMYNACWRFHDAFITLSWRFHDASWCLMLSLHFHDAFMMLSWRFHGTFMMLSWCFHDDFMMLSWRFHYAFITLSWCFHDTFMTLSWHFHDAFMML